MHKRGVFLRMLMHEDVIFGIAWYAAPSSTTYGDRIDLIKHRMLHIVYEMHDIKSRLY